MRRMAKTGRVAWAASPPLSNYNLTEFLRSYKKFGEYFLAPVVLQNGSSVPVLVGNNFIAKRELHVREAW